MNIYKIFVLFKWHIEISYDMIVLMSTKQSLQTVYLSEKYSGEQKWRLKNGS